MHTHTLLLLLLCIVLYILLQRARQAPAAHARKLLAEGALLIDVRSPAEFAGGHLPKAINLPLDRLADELPRIAPDLSRPLLLHCQSGVRSASAASRAKALGYQTALNLGSYARAASIVGR